MQFSYDCLHRLGTGGINSELWKGEIYGGRTQCTDMLCGESQIPIYAVYMHKDHNGLIGMSVAKSNMVVAALMLE